MVLGLIKLYQSNCVHTLIIKKKCIVLYFLHCCDPFMSNDPLRIHKFALVCFIYWHIYWQSLLYHNVTCICIFLFASSMLIVCFANHIIVENVKIYIPPSLTIYQWRLVGSNIEYSYCVTHVENLPLKRLHLLLYKKRFYKYSLCTSKSSFLYFNAY